jgi:hypothetical protein
MSFHTPISVYAFVGWIASIASYGMYCVEYTPIPAYEVLRTRCDIAPFCVFDSGIFVLWTCVPEQSLHGAGITYYPSKCVLLDTCGRSYRSLYARCTHCRDWAVAVPAYLIVVWLLSLCVYTGLAMVRMPAFSSFEAVIGELVACTTRCREPINRLLSDVHTQTVHKDHELFMDQCKVPTIGDLPIGCVTRSYLG